MSVKTYKSIIRNCKHAITNISQQSTVTDADVAAAEAFQAAIDMAERRLLRLTMIEPRALKAAVKFGRRLERLPKEPWGTYGEWDYPNKQWQREPTAADIPEIARQKRLRDPNSTLWQSEDKIAEWLKNRPNPQLPSAK